MIATVTLTKDALPPHVDPAIAMRLDLFSQRTVYENPYETMIPAIHRGPRAAYVTNIFPGDRPGWLLRRHEDVRAMLLDADGFKKNGYAQWSRGIGESWLSIPTETDPPVHGLYRQTLNPQFSPQRMAAMIGQIQARARRLVDAFKTRGSCDFLGEFSVVYPASIVLDLLGLPQERVPEFLGWEQDLVHTGDMEVRGRATRAVKAYLLEEIAARRAAPRDDYISRVLDFEIEGRKWNDDEVFGHCFNLFVGGLDTVTSQLGLMFHHLATHPDDQRRLREDPSLTAVAVLELMRAYAPVTSFRICTTETEFAGVRMMPGEYVALSTPVVGRDPEQYDRPQDIRLDRRPMSLALGGGVHKCLGMHLALRELQIAIDEFLAAVPDFHIKGGFAVPFHVGNILHVQALRLEWMI
jgi:cytochrome P450